MTMVVKGKCNKCGSQWYWCQECGAAGCANAQCPNQRHNASSGMLFSTQTVKYCGICKSSR